MKKSNLNLENFLDDLEIFNSFKTIQDQNEEFLKCIQWIKNYFQKVQSKIEFIEIEKNGIFSIILKPVLSKKPHILGFGHIDVVPANDDFYTVIKKENWIYGRGVADMKNQNLIMMKVFLEEIQKNENSNFWLLFTGDEEIGSQNGAKYVSEYMKNKNILPEICFIPDAGPNFGFIEKEKGATTFSCEMKGKSSHGSRPFLGENAIEKTISFFHDLKKLIPENPKSETDWKNSFSMTVIKGGKAQNKIPNYCYSEFDIRLTEKSNYLQFFEKIKKISQQYKNCTVKPLNIFPSTYFPKEKEINQKFIKLIEKTIHRKPEIIHTNGGSDSKYFSQFGIDVFLTNMNIHDLHGENERCEISSIPKMYDLLKNLIRNF